MYRMIHDSKPIFSIMPHLANRIKMGVCATCPNSIEEKHFTSELSKKEYSISGMCQECQDKIFGSTDEESGEDMPW